MVDGGRRYADMLRVIGARLDAQGYQDIVLCEVVDGFIASAAPAENATALGLAFSFGELAAGAAAPPAADAAGGISYQRLLGALGGELDRARAHMVTILESPIGLLVSYFPDGYQLEGCYGTRHEFVYQPEDLRELVAGSLSAG